MCSSKVIALQSLCSAIALKEGTGDRSYPLNPLSFRLAIKTRHLSYYVRLLQKSSIMARLSDEILTTIFNLQRQLVEGINEAAATELAIFEQFGEIEITIPPLKQLQNARQRLTEPYSRLGMLLLRIAESQPTDLTVLLDQTIEQAQAAVDASQASIREAKEDFNLL